MTGVRPSDHTILSDVIMTLQMLEIQIFWEGILTVEANGREWILTKKQGGAGFTLTGALHVRARMH